MMGANYSTRSSSCVISPISLANPLPVSHSGRDLSPIGDDLWPRAPGFVLLLLQVVRVDVQHRGEDLVVVQLRPIHPPLGSLAEIPEALCRLRPVGGDPEAGHRRTTTIDTEPSAPTAQNGDTVPPSAAARRSSPSPPDFLSA